MSACIDADKPSERKRKRVSFANDELGGNGKQPFEGELNSGVDATAGTIDEEEHAFGQVSAKEAAIKKKERQKRMRLEGSALAAESIDFDSGGGGRDGSKAQGEEGSVTGAKEDEGPFTAFNLDENREDGYFDDNNNFVWRKGEQTLSFLLPCLRCCLSQTNLQFLRPQCSR